MKTIKASTPNYKQIYLDILQDKCTETNEKCQIILRKKDLTALDIVEINQKIFGINSESFRFNQKCKSYSKAAILKILEYQKSNCLNNVQTAKHFNMSRNTIASWKKLFLV